MGDTFYLTRMSIFSRFSLWGLRTSFLWAFRRFPLPTLLAVILAWLFFYIIKTEPSDVIYPRIIFSLVITFFLSIGTVLFLETWSHPPLDRFFPVIPLLYGVFFYFMVEPRVSMWVESVTYFLLHLAGFVSLIFFAPYIARILEGKEGSIEYTNYFSRIAWVFLMSAIVWGSLFALGAIAILSVTSLFDLSDYVWNSKLYGYWATISLSIIAPIYGLIQMPYTKEIDKKSYEINRFFSFLIKYVAVPFIYIYFAILYAYSVKVLMNFSVWPKGIICYMVIWFSSFGYLVYIFSKAYEDSEIVSLFRRYFPFVVIPELFMLAYSIGLRISQYDITMNRYFVVIFGLWLLGISLYYILSQKKSLAIIVASLTIISLVISLGPWSVFALPLSRQSDRLTRNLVTAKILENGKITPLSDKSAISKELSGDIYSGISYLCSFDDCSRVKALFPVQVADIEAVSRANWEKYNTITGSTYPGLGSWEIVSGVTEKIKVLEWFDPPTTEPLYKQYSSKNPPDGQYPLEVKGYDRIVSVYGESQWWVEVRYPFISINPDDATLRYHTASGVLEKIALPSSMLTIQGYGETPLEAASLIYTITWSRSDIRLLLNSYAVRNPAYSGWTDKNNQYYYINGFALVKDRK